LNDQQPGGQQLSPSEDSVKGYYGVPVIHRPHWKWLVIMYFFFGGISGASAVIASFARLRNGSQGASLARIATYVSFLALAPCPLLLILDLGRPQRFLNMLRVFKTSSPMSIGTWGLTLFGMVITLSTVLQFGNDRAARAGRSSRGTKGPVARAIALLSALSGFFVAGYTGILLAATAVPLWSKRPILLGPLFLSSAMTSGTAAITAVATARRFEDRTADHRLRTLETISTISEGVLLVGWIVALGPTARPLTEGRLGKVVRHGVVGTGIMLPLLISAAVDYLPRQLRRAATLIASALTLSGVFALRFAIVEGGRQSADDPQATFEMTG
jgi:formate-dependent nitrite reductase membrane component NrfD